MSNDNDHAPPLPWRPIADLPPHLREPRHKVLLWDAEFKTAHLSFWIDDDEGGWWFSEGGVGDPSHFLEIAGPGA